MNFFSLPPALLLSFVIQGSLGSVLVNDELVPRLNTAISDPPCLICNVAPTKIQYDHNEAGSITDFLTCTSESSQEANGKANQVYLLDQLPQAFIREYERELFSGKSRICIHHGQIDQISRSVVIPANTTIQMLPTVTRRRLSPTLGHSTVLVVRVTSTAGEDPGLTANELAATVFGIGPDAVSINPISQYGACSNNKWNLTAAVGTRVSNGILEVTYFGQIRGSDIAGGYLLSDLNDLVRAAMGVDELSMAADHILFCLPDGSVQSTGTSSWFSLAIPNAGVGYFQKKYCQSLSSVAWNIGVQIGFKKSGKGINPSGDLSCMMGASYSFVGRPQECFNGHKNWISGWFDDSKLTVRPLQNGPWIGNLVGFVDYSLRAQVPNSATVINVGDLYIQLNSAKKHNRQVAENGNKVTVVQSNETSAFSNLLVGLASGESYNYSNFNGSGIALVIQVCNLTFGTVDYARLSLHLHDGVQTSQCSSPQDPSKQPSTSPTRTPTRGPSKTPSTSSPTRTPTFRPSKKPSRFPTRKPTRRPSKKPSRKPTRKPTRRPTRKPSR